jgi:hypothetical protein
MVIDQTTLPRGAVMTTTSSRNVGDAMSMFLDPSNGEMTRADFAVGSCSNTVIEQVKARRTRGEVNSVTPTQNKKGEVLKFIGKPTTLINQSTDSAKQGASAYGNELLIPAGSGSVYPSAK